MQGSKVVCVSVGGITIVLPVSTVGVGVLLGDAPAVGVREGVGVLLGTGVLVAVGDGPGLGV